MLRITIAGIVYVVTTERELIDLLAALDTARAYRAA